MIVDDPVHAAQRTFRALLSALSHPGRVIAIDERVAGPPEVGPALTAAIFTLVDRDVAVWVSANAPASIHAWLISETGCRIVAEPADADFAILLDARDALPLERWNPGTAEEPERSATLLVRVAALTGGRGVALGGPGIDARIVAAPAGVPDNFWTGWAVNAARYPMGIDCFFFDSERVSGLPRTTIELDVAATLPE